MMLIPFRLLCLAIKASQECYSLACHGHYPPHVAEKYGSQPRGHMALQNLQGGKDEPSRKS